MKKNPKSITRLLLTLVCLLSMLLVGIVNDCHAKEKKNKQQYSNDFKEFPAGSPEAVLTTFIESDFKDAEDRYLNLTESGDIPNCGYPTLLINSYKINNKFVDKQTGEVTVNLELDVRAIEAGANRDPDAQCKNKTIYVNNSKRTLSSVGSTNHFVETILEQPLLNSDKQDNNYYFVPKDRRKWSFPVRMVKRQGKWVIATESIPLITTYVSMEINAFINQIFKYNSIIEVCKGKLSIQRYVKEKRQLDYASTEIGTDLKRFRNKYCTTNEVESIEIHINTMMQTIKKLKECAKE